MKKIISLLLALIMAFSVCSVAFAADDTVAQPEAPAEGGDVMGDLDFLLDLPLWTAKPMLKVAKIALKLVKVVVKVCAVFGIEPGDIIEKIEELINQTQNGGEEATTAAPTTPAPATPALA